MRATAIPRLHGIKQANLPPSDDLLHSTLQIFRAGEYPEDYVPVVGNYACLLLAPYREFLKSVTGHPSPVVLDRYLGSGQEGLGGICASTGAGDSLASVLGLTTQGPDMMSRSP